MSEIEDKLEEALEKVKFYESLFDSMNASIYVMEQDPLQVSWLVDNDYLHRKLEISAKSVIDKGVSYRKMLEINKGNIESIGKAAAFFKENPDKKEWAGVYQLPSPSGDNIWVLYTSGVLKKNLDGSPKKIVCVAIHVTDDINTALAYDIFTNAVQKKKRKELFKDLTSREIQVLKLLGKGHSQKEIGDILDIADSTVETYKARLFKKLKVRSSVDLALLADRFGILKIK